MAIKLLIKMDGGIVDAIYCTNYAVEVVVINSDMVDINADQMVSSMKLDHVRAGEFHTLFTDTNDPVEMEIRDTLKTMKY